MPTTRMLADVEARAVGRSQVTVESPKRFCPSCA